LWRQAGFATQTLGCLILTFARPGCAALLAPLAAAAAVAPRDALARPAAATAASAAADAASPPPAASAPSATASGGAAGGDGYEAEHAARGEDQV